MNIEGREEAALLGIEEILDKTKALTQLLKNTDSYRQYLLHLERLEGRPEIYRELNSFRKKNLEIQMAAEDAEYYEKTDALQREYKDILMEPVVMDFLTSEQTVCRILRLVYHTLAEEMELDISYMEEE